MHSVFASASTRRTLLALALITSLSGCATGPATTNLADTIAATPSLGTLHDLLTKSGLNETLKTGGPYTVFAPTNDAFAAVPAKTMAELTANPDKLRDVLAYHVINGTRMAADIKNSTAKTLNGSDVALSRAGNFVTVENAAVTQSDVVAGNGVIHLIDTVLTPPKK